MTLEVQTIALLNTHFPYWCIVAGVVIVFVAWNVAFQRKK